MLLSKCVVRKCLIVKKSKFIKDQEDKGLLGKLLLGKVPILGDIPLVKTLF